MQYLQDSLNVILLALTSTPVVIGRIGGCLWLLPWCIHYFKTERERERERDVKLLRSDLQAVADAGG